MGRTFDRMLGWRRQEPSIDAATMHFLERHETRAHAIGGRELRDLGDALLLFDANDRDPFWNRLAATSLPEEEAEFDRRIGELITLFATLDRRPHLVTAPVHVRPTDLATRLRGHGFEDLGGGLVMVLTDPHPLGSVAIPDRMRIERHSVPLPEDRRRLADEVAGLLVSSFRVDPVVHPRLVVDLLRSFDAPELTIYLARVGETPVGVAKRTSFDGATYLSSIGTRPGWEGHGIGGALTAAACLDGADDGCGLVYLGVFAHNERARSLYARLGFVTVGGPTGDFVLR
jgi:ribosomal protein S18 acetylase RimI-like enzyme